MHAELKSKWTAALRGGDFQQGKGKLLNDGRYCCLGVLCAITGAQWGDWPEDMPERRWADDLVPTQGSILLSDEENTELNLDALRRFGITHETQTQLINMNDGLKHGTTKMREHSFSEIADWIEANL